MATLPYEIEVPDKMVQHIRLWLSDMPQFNRLIEGTETSDEKIRLAVQLLIQYFNTMPPVLSTEYNATNFPNYKILYHGVAIEVLTMAGIVQSRNFLNFNDGGVSFSVSDKGQSYMGWIQNLMQTYAQDIRDLKAGLNAEEGYDFITSPEYAWFDWENNGAY